MHTSAQWKGTSVLRFGKPSGHASEARDTCTSNSTQRANLMCGGYGKVNLPEILWITETLSKRFARERGPCASELRLIGDVCTRAAGAQG